MQTLDSDLYTAQEKAITSTQRTAEAAAPATLEKGLRGTLEKTIKAARSVAETAAHAAVDQLGVGHDKPEAFLSEAEKALRNRLRTHGKQLGDARDSKSTNPTYGKQEVQHLVQEVAYQHWHRMLFARFLAENDLLLYDGVAVTIEECNELAAEEGAASGWELAGKLAARMLPQIFRPDSPVFQLRLPQEHQYKLELLVAKLQQEVFSASDSLGWVYQFWQANNKDRINKSGSKIGANELPAVTQLFTEDYMVDFLLDNTLGAWHACQVLIAHPKLAHSENELRQAAALPNVPWKYLRFTKCVDGKWLPAAGRFDGWPKMAKELKCLDPCMGSGHFLVAMFDRLVAMRMVEEELDEKTAVAAVIRENLFGLELDPRCTQIAAFNLALAAWRRVGHCVLPAMNLACSGLAPNASEADWLAIADDNEKLQRGMERLYRLFQKAAVLGSLINPRGGTGDLLAASFDELRPLLEKALAHEALDDGVAHEMAVAAQGITKAAEILADEFTLVATNVPYLSNRKQCDDLKNYCTDTYPDAKNDLGVTFMLRLLDLCSSKGSVALVMSQYWLFKSSYSRLRRSFLQDLQWPLIAKLGVGAFETISGEVVNVLAGVWNKSKPQENCVISGINVMDFPSPAEKAEALIGGSLAVLSQDGQLRNSESRIVIGETSEIATLELCAIAPQGIKTGDDDRWRVCMWEVDASGTGWVPYQTTVRSDVDYGGRHLYLDWRTGGTGMIRPRIENLAIGKWGVAISQSGDLPATIYSGERFDSNVAPLIIRDPTALPALWAYCTSADYLENVRRIDQSLKVTNVPLIQVPFDLAHWQKVAAEKYPDGLPKPSSSDPTQWLFSGHPAGSDKPLQVAVARLLGYRWPRQVGSNFPDCPALAPDGLEKLADNDGVVCIPPVGQEASASDRLLNLLAAAYGDAWSNDTLSQLLTTVDHAGKSLESWLRDKFFTQHCKLFMNRPFVWHVWDGLSDGFSALLNYHRLNYKTLESLIYTYLGDWIGRQKRDADGGVDGALEKLAAAEGLKKRLELILAGEAPYDIFVRWKPIEEQPIGWNPDFNDGVRLNIRPFLSVPDVGKRGAGVLRDKPNIKWEKDRGSDVHSAPWYELGLQYGGKVGDRINDHHLTLAEKQAARAKQGNA